MAGKLLLKLAVVWGIAYPLWLLTNDGLMWMCNVDPTVENTSRLVESIGMLLNKTAKIGIWLLMFRTEIRLLLKWLGCPLGWLKAALLPFILAPAFTASSLVIGEIFEHWPFLYYAGLISADSCTPQHETILLQIFCGMLGIVIGPILEEMFFRGIAFLVLLRLLGKWPAIIVCVLGFAFVHSYVFSHWARLLDLLAAGAFAFYLLFKTRRLSSCILFHTLHNAILSVVWVYKGLPLSHGI